MAVPTPSKAEAYPIIEPFWPSGREGQPALTSGGHSPCIVAEGISFLGIVCLETPVEM